MRLFKTKQAEIPPQRMPEAEDFASWGARELTTEELFMVNGGGQSRWRQKPSGSNTKKGTASGGSANRTNSNKRVNSQKTGGIGSSKKNKGSGKQTKTGGAGVAVPEKKTGENNADSGSKPPSYSGKKDGTKKKTETGSTKGTGSYTVKKGDTLSRIVSKKYPNASREEIARKVKEAAANSGIKNPNLIRPGQKIRFDSPTESGSGTDRLSPAAGNEVIPKSNKRTVTPTGTRNNQKTGGTSPTNVSEKGSVLKSMLKG